ARTAAHAVALMSPGIRGLAAAGHALHAEVAATEPHAPPLYMLPPTSAALTDAPGGGGAASDR
ncbi:MAG: hypothetical protein ACK4ZJ_18410, partial [Allorhizobium sp.]